MVRRGHIRVERELVRERVLGVYGRCLVHIRVRIMRGTAESCGRTWPELCTAAGEQASGEPGNDASVRLTWFGRRRQCWRCGEHGRMQSF